MTTQASSGARMTLEQWADLPPSIAVEILSARPRDERRDRVEKLREYAAFGVRWYWIVDPQTRIFEIHELGSDGRYATAAAVDGGRIDPVPGARRRDPGDHDHHRRGGRSGRRGHQSVARRIVHARGRRFEFERRSGGVDPGRRRGKNGDPAAVVVLVLTGDCDAGGDCEGILIDAANPAAPITGAEPAPRMREFAMGFQYGSVGPICAPDFAPFFADAVSVIESACDDFMPPG